LNKASGTIEVFADTFAIAYLLDSDFFAFWMRIREYRTRHAGLSAEVLLVRAFVQYRVRECRSSRKPNLWLDEIQVPCLGDDGQITWWARPLPTTADEMIKWAEEHIQKHEESWQKASKAKNERCLEKLRRCDTFMAGWEDFCDQYGIPADDRRLAKAEEHGLLALPSAVCYALMASLSLSIAARLRSSERGDESLRVVASIWRQLARTDPGDDPKAFDQRIRACTALWHEALKMLKGQFRPQQAGTIDSSTGSPWLVPLR